LLLSLCLAKFIPVGVEFASTWRQLYSKGDGFNEQVYLMPIGFFSLGFVMIGLIVLWTKYRKRNVGRGLSCSSSSFSLFFPATYYRYS
jgi:hypothetical protein